MDIAIFSWIGGRGYMEDFHCLVENFNCQEGQIFGGVFDGHGGMGVAKYAAEKVPQYILELMEEQRMSIPDAFKKVYRQVSDEREDLTTGCTALSFLINNKGCMTVANAGDSRMIIVSDGKIDQVTIDHSLSNVGEVERIFPLVEWVGELNDNYVWKGDRGLMPTRSLGDHWFDDVGVIAEPEIFSREIPQSSDTFIVAATDGIWSELGNGAVADLIVGKKTAHEAGMAIIKFIKENSQRYRLDNITLIVLKP